MNTEILKRRFNEIGAKLKIDCQPIQNGRFWQPLQVEFDLNVIEDKKGDQFFLRIREDVWKEYEFAVPNLDAKDRHLLLVARKPRNPRFAKEKFLCGHDERHWFVAGLQNASVTDTRGAKEFLKPAAAKNSQLHNGVSAKNWHKRQNSGFVRQGEWFFIPRPRFEPSKRQLLFRNEPLQRNARSKPHMVAELVRSGGTPVYVHRRSNVILNPEEYGIRQKTDPNFYPPHWIFRRMNPTVHVRGTVRHPDHYTIHLNGWHEVVMNNEPTSNSVAFLD